MLLDLLNNNINVIEKVDDWKEAIRVASQPLIISNSIDEGYIDAMITMCEKYKGYIVLNDFFAMPHASYENGVNKLSASLLIINEPVYFFEKPVHIVLVIAPINNTAHIEFIKDVSLYFNDVEFILELSHIHSALEVKNLLNNVVREE